MKKTLFVLVLCAFVTLLAFSASAATVASGTCGAEGDGSNLTWVLDDSGTLTISGTGAMADYPYRGSPWQDYCSSYDNVNYIKSIVVQNGVSNIGDYAFNNCVEATSVVLPDSVTAIGTQAFDCCYLLEEVVLPQNLKSIDMSAFNGCHSLETVTVPASVVQIGRNPFGRCVGLTEIIVHPQNSEYCSVEGVLYNKDMTELIQYPAGKTPESFVVPDTVKEIGGHAFVSNGFIESVILPDGLEEIGHGAFELCNSLATITIPRNVNNIGVGAFAACASLTGIYVDSLNEVYCDIDGVLLDKEKTTLWQFPNGKNVDVYTVPSGVKTIYDSAFLRCILSNIVLPSSVDTIGGYAFYGCNNLTTIQIPQEVKEIGYYAFGECENLETLTIPESVESLEGEMFIYCSNLTELIVYSKTATFGTNMFDYGGSDNLTIYCYAGSTAQEYAIENDIPYVLLDEDVTTDGFLYVKIYNIIVIIGYVGQGGEVTIPSEIDGLPVTSIGAFAFENCSNITKIHIPASITSIGTGAFHGCTGLTGFTIDIDNLYFCILNGVLFSKDMTELVCYPAGKTDTTYTVPSTVKLIGKYAFSINIYITVIILPDGLTEIGDFAFYGCSALTTLEIPVSVTVIGVSAFDACGSLTIICVKNSTAYDYAIRNGIAYTVSGVLDDSDSSGSSTALIAAIASVSNRKVTVEFFTAGANIIAPQTVKKGGTVIEPESPTKSGYTFAGWYTDSERTEKFDFADGVAKDMTLFAKWVANDNRIIMTVGSTEASVFGNASVNDVAPIIENDRTMLPARFVAENLGATVSWDGAARKVTVIGGGMIIEIYIDSTVAYVNGGAVTLDSPAFIRGDRTYTPVRFIAETLGAAVEWNSANRQVIITK